MSRRRQESPTLLADAAALAIPRQAGGEGDALTRRLLRDALARAGLAVAELPFCVRPRPLLLRLRVGFGLQAAAFALAAAAPSSLPALAPAAALGLAGVLLLRSLVRGGAGQAHGPAGDGNGDGDGVSTSTLLARIGEKDSPRAAIVIAHHDSKSQNLSLLPRLLLSGLIVAGLALLASSVLGVSAWPASRRAVFLAAAAAAAAMSAVSFADESPGALDNAGSLSVALSLARELVAAPPAGGQVLLAFTGAEEWMMAGARHLQRRLRREGLDPLHSMVFNLDGVGGPGPVGLAGPRAHRRLVKAWVGGVARLREMPWIPGSFTDATIFSREGWRAVTLTSSSLGRGVRAVHTARDRPENLDSAALEQALGTLRRAVRGFLGEQA